MLISQFCKLMPVCYPPAIEKLAVLHISTTKFRLSRLSQMQNQAIWRAEEKIYKKKKTLNKLRFVGIFLHHSIPDCVDRSQTPKIQI